MHKRDAILIMLLLTLAVCLSGCLLAAVGAGAAGTVAGVLPSFNNSLWAKVTTVLLWLLFAREGYDSLIQEDEQ